MRLAASRTFWTAGSSSPIKTAMMAITTNNSSSVKPRRWVVFDDLSMSPPHWLGESRGTDFQSRPDGWENRPTMDSLTLRHLAQSRQVPHLHRLVAAAGVQTLAVGTERQAADETGVASEAVDQFPAAAVPDLHGAVLPAGGDPPALVVGAEGHRVDVPAVSREGAQLLAGLHVPDLDRVPITPRRQPPTVRAKGHVQTRPGNS